MLLRKVEVFLRKTGMPATKFGRLATRDPRFVLDLRLGRSPRSQMEQKVNIFMANYLESRDAG